MLQPVDNRRYHDPQFTKQTVRETRLSYLRDKHATYRSLAEELNTSHVTVRKMITGVEPYDYA